MRNKRGCNKNSGFSDLRLKLNTIVGETFLCEALHGLFSKIKPKTVVRYIEDMIIDGYLTGDPEGDITVRELMPETYVAKGGTTRK